MTEDDLEDGSEKEYKGSKHTNWDDRKLEWVEKKNSYRQLGSDIVIVFKFKKNIVVIRMRKLICIYIVFF